MRNMNGDRTATQQDEQAGPTSFLTPEAQAAMVAQLAAVAAESTLYCFRAETKEGVAATADLSELFTTGPVAGHLHELADDNLCADLDQAWRHAVKNVLCRTLLPGLQDPAERVWWSVLNLAPSKDLVLIAVDDKPANYEPKLIAPRVAHLVLDSSAAVIRADDAFFEMFGYAGSDVFGHPTLPFVHPDDQVSAIESYAELLQCPGGSVRSTVRYVTAEGNTIWVEATNRNRLNELGIIEREIVDVQSEVEAKHELYRKHQMLKAVTESLPSGIAQLDQNMDVVFSNKRWSEIVGCDANASFDDYLTNVVDPSGVETSLQVAIEDSGEFEADITIRVDSALRRCSLVIRSLYGRAGECDGYVVSATDVTDSWTRQNKLEEQATHDRLTGLFNRRGIMDRLEQLVETAALDGSGITVAFLDLDGLKLINDEHGHIIGDELLLQIGQVAKSNCRIGEWAARIGGDEFVVVSLTAANAAAAITVGERFSRSINGTYEVAGVEIEVQTSCGVAFDCGGRFSPDRLIAQADAAMYEHKRSDGEVPGCYDSSGQGGVLLDHAPSRNGLPGPPSGTPSRSRDLEWSDSALSQSG